MKTQEYRTDDKSEWPRGEWDDEPDKIQWPDAETGLPCLIHRNRCGALCGYVGVAPGHPMYAVKYNDGAEDLLDVHGSLSYSAFCQDTNCEETGVCHVVEEGEEKKIWWFGFDCHHAWDIAPGMPFGVGMETCEHTTYKNVAFVKGEVTALAKQLEEMRSGKGIGESGDGAPREC